MLNISLGMFLFLVLIFFLIQFVQFSPQHLPLSQSCLFSIFNISHGDAKRSSTVLTPTETHSQSSTSPVSPPPPLMLYISAFYSNTEQANVYLTRSSPLSLYHSIQYNSRTIYLCWHHLTDAVRSVHIAAHNLYSISH